MSLLLALQGGGSGGASQSLAATLDDVSISVNQTTQHPQSVSLVLGDVSASLAQTKTRPQALTATLDDAAVAINQTRTRSQTFTAALDGIAADVAQTATHPQSLDAPLDDVLAQISQAISGGPKTQALEVTLGGLDVSVTQESSATPASGGASPTRPRPLSWPHHAIPHRRPRKRRQEDILFM